MNILVIDGQGGRLGRKLVESIRRVCPDAVITAVGTNSTATESMMGTGCADHLATGENAVIVACRTAHIIAGPFGIATADAMMGEISPAMDYVTGTDVQAVFADVCAHRVLVREESGRTAEAVLQDLIKTVETPDHRCFPGLKK